MIVFLGSQTINYGVIIAKAVALDAGNQIRLDFNGDSLLSLCVDTRAIGSSSVETNGKQTLTVADSAKIGTTATRAARPATYCWKNSSI